MGVVRLVQRVWFVRQPLVDAAVWLGLVRVLRFLKGGTDRLRRRDCCFDRSKGRPLAGSVQAPAVGGLSLARECASPSSAPIGLKAEGGMRCAQPNGTGRADVSWRDRIRRKARAPSWRDS